MRNLSHLRSLVLTLALMRGEASAQVSQPPVFAASTQAIYIDVTVERKAQQTPRLVSSDFRLFDNGVPQAFELVPAEDLPVRAILVFDTSGSMKGAKIAELSRAALDFVSRLGSRDEASLLTFATVLEWSGAPGPAPAGLQASLTDLRAEGATSLYDALYSALVLPGAGSRVLVVVFSDGADTSSWLTDAKIRLAAERSNALIHAVVLPDRALAFVAAPPRSTRMGDGGIMGGGQTVIVKGETAPYLRTLRDVAESTGGSLVMVQSAQQIGQAFSSILDEVRARYVLRYDPATTPAPGWHRLEVRLTSGKKEGVRTRAGYWVR